MVPRNSGPLYSAGMGQATTPALYTAATGIIPHASTLVNPTVCSILCKSARPQESSHTWYTETKQLPGNASFFFCAFFSALKVQISTPHFQMINP